MTAVMVSSFQFEVGGKNGWTKPTENESETYNEWAVQNRFRIGGTLFFKYKNDSVEEVSASNHFTCNVLNPMVKFSDMMERRFSRSGGRGCFIPLAGVLVIAEPARN
ncbi:unnamed protein product [Cuscuta epithymum]|nr:unnamed protein product [Cuscuta epithymum]